MKKLFAISSIVCMMASSFAAVSTVDLPPALTTADTLTQYSFQDYMFAPNAVDGSIDLTRVIQSDSVTTESYNHVANVRTCTSGRGAHCGPYHLVTTSLQARSNVSTVQYQKGDPLQVDFKFTVNSPVSFSFNTQVTYASIIPDWSISLFDPAGLALTPTSVVDPTTSVYSFSTPGVYDLRFQAPAINGLSPFTILATPLAAITAPAATIPEPNSMILFLIGSMIISLIVIRKNYSKA